MWIRANDQSAEDRLGLLEAVPSAFEKRQNIVEAVGAAAGRPDAAATVPGLQIWRMTADSRAELATAVARLRGLRDLT